MHRLVNFDPIFDCVLGSFYKARFRLIAGFLLMLFSKLIEFSYRDTLFFDSFFPYSHVLISLFLLSLSFFFFFLHPEDLFVGICTSASSGMAKGLSYLGMVGPEGNRGKLPFLESSS